MDYTTIFDISGVNLPFPCLSETYNPYLKNYSNCDIIGSFYTVGDTVDISGNSIWDIYNSKIDSTIKVDTENLAIQKIYDVSNSEFWNKSKHQ